MIKAKYTFLIIFGVLCAAYGKADAQVHEADSLVRLADELHAKYDFARAVDIYEDALEILEDTTAVEADSLKILSVRDRLLLSENGLSMSSYSYSPAVVARHKFSLDDFFLYYPLKDRSWRTVPNQLDTSAADGLTRALYAPEGDDRLYFSAEDQEGIRNIYMTELKDTVWTLPSLLNEHMTSPSDEIYPMLSHDGRFMYFASAGLYGVGGYDIYVSEWSEAENDWAAPVNMGFPYSSPADDFLLVNTEDDAYTVFASNRECSADSVWVYVLEYDNMPVRHAADDPETLRKLSLLDPSDVHESMENTEVSADIPENMDTRRYMDKMEEIRALRDSLSHYSVSLDQQRSRFAMSNDYSERMKLTEEILKHESRIPQVQDSLDRAVAQLQKIEMEFLFNGVVIDPDKMMAEADREIVVEATSYTFTKMNMGPELELRMMEPEKKFDYSFKVLEVGQFAEDNTIPDGIVYQIQIFSSINKASVKSLKGLSPVFERRNAGGRYVYRVGLFNSYNDVLSKLNTVKRAGFRTAFITAYINGKEVSVSKARTEEARKPAAQVFHQVTVIPEGGELDPAISEGIRQQASGKDIARTEMRDGRIAYVVGPFSDKISADELVSFVKAMGIEDVSCEVLANEVLNN